MPPALLGRLMDDAAQYPPAELPLAQALAAHRELRAGPRAPFVGRFLVPAARVAELLGSIRPGETWELGVIGEPMAVAQALSLAEAAPGVAVTACEVPALAGLPDGAPAFVEPPREALGRPGLDALLDELATARGGGRAVGAKLRCGGAAAAAFPTRDEVAGFIAGCVARGLPFKATAGLHQPLPHRDPVTGAEHHGFLGLWAATAAAGRGAGRPELVAILASSDPLEAGGVSFDQLGVARALFTGFGTCSVGEPLDGLEQLGLIGRGVAVGG
jgi:hypothetical protein